MNGIKIIADGLGKATTLLCADTSNVTFAGIKWL
jgi:hypothetical protein